MTDAIPVSVVVVSRGRPALLQRALTGIGQLWYPNFEIVVVADEAGRDAVAAMGWQDRVKLAACDEANISKARNIGIGLAAGEVVALIDDDAVPEPTWLTHLIAPFADPDVVQTGGFVRARNGITFQWPVRAVDALGRTRKIDHAGTAPFTPDLRAGEAVKTEGTNMALRRAVITGIGGFDEAFRFYLDETDVNFRLATRKTVITPLAQVHHGFAGSESRRANRGAADLTEIGASTAAYLRKHAKASEVEETSNRLYSSQNRRLLGQMVDGTLSPDEIAPLLRTLENGIEQGRRRDVGQPADFSVPPPAFHTFSPATSGKSRILSGRFWNGRQLAREAQKGVAGGDVITVFRFSPTALSHRAAFNPKGYWEQWGGLFGRSDRGQPWFRWARFGERVRKEQARLLELRFK
ncbi:MAG: glycosyltransferase family 2 protein [Pseudomonadota bacterium]|nr:glycosyltransferase family 2 protein [Pseudomonadota bacterium]